MTRKKPAPPKRPARKKAAKKKAPARKKRAVQTPTATRKPTGFNLGETVPTSGVSFRPRSNSTKYDTLIESALKLRVGQSLLVATDETGEADEAELIALRNRIGAVVRRKVQPHIRGKIRMRIDADNRVVICCQ